jgi:hypothetical protein
MKYSAIKYAIEQGFCSMQDLRDGRYFVNNGIPYNEDDYTEISGGDVYPADETFYCEHFEEFYHEDDAVSVYTGRHSVMWSQEAANRYANVFQGEYYDDGGASYHGLVFVDGELYHQDSVYYWESDGDYHKEEETGFYVREYHNGSYKKETFGEKSKWRIGFEIEKEDQQVKESLEITDFENDLPNWRKERDGSLDCESGFELISPTFEFDINAIFELIENSSILTAHINADFSKSCGGHIHLSNIDKSGQWLFDRVKGYLPLLYAMFPGRANSGSYCAGKSAKDLKTSSEKYQAVRIFNNRIEFRIFGAVKNVANLKFRAELVRKFITYPAGTPEKGLYNMLTKLRPQLEKVYDTPEKFTALTERVISFSKQFENKDL